MTTQRYFRLFLALGLAMGSAAALAQTVKITPLGSHTGEFCDRDRATIFEDPTGFVIHFTNGLKVYLSGDTGLHTEMKTVVRDFHKVNLAVLNLGQNAIAPDAAAYAINELIQPVTVIASHPNEGVTTGGKVRPNTRTKQFMDLVKGRAVYLALSGKTMEFDGSANCVTGCW